MGSLEDRYEKQEAAAKQAAATRFVPAYNRFLDIIREITTEMHARITANPPDRYEWINAEGTRYVGWQLWSNWEGDEFFYLLSTGQVAYVTGGPASKKKLKYVVSLKRVSQAPRSYWQNGRLPLDTLRDLCQSVVQLPTNYGFADDPRYQGWWRDGRRPS